MTTELGLYYDVGVERPDRRSDRAHERLVSARPCASPDRTCQHVLIVDDDRLVAEAIAALIESGRPGCRVSTCCSAQHALGLLDTGRRFDLALVDVSMPGIDGMALLEAFASRDSSPRTVLMSARDDERSVRAAIGGGAVGFLAKALPTASFLAQIDRALAGRRVFPDAPDASVRDGRPASATRAIPAPGTQIPSLGARQRQILRLVAQGHSNKRIGHLLCITEATVKYHVHRLFRTLGVRNRTSCVREGRRLGLIDEGGRVSAATLPAGADRRASASAAAQPSALVGPRADLVVAAAVETVADGRHASSIPAGLLDAPPQRAYDDLVRLATAALAAPVGLVTIIDRPRDRQWFVSQVGVPEPWATRRQTPLSHSFCRHVVDTGAAFSVGDAHVHPVVRDNPAVEELGVTAYLGAPVHAPGGEALGALCVIDARPRHWSVDDVAILERLARCTSDTIALRAALIASEAARADQEDFVGALAKGLQGPLEALATLCGAPPPAALASPETMRETVRAGVRAATRVEAVVEALVRCARTAGTPFVPKPVALGALVIDVLAELDDEFDTMGAEVEVGSLPIVPGDPEQLGVLFRHLIDNAVRFAAPHRAAHVRLRARSAPGSVEIEVSDNGTGVAPEHRERAFGLFRRCAGDTGSPSSGLGLALCRRIAANHGGTVTLGASSAGGSAVTVRLPTVSPAP